MGQEIEYPEYPAQTELLLVFTSTKTDHFISLSVYREKLVFLPMFLLLVLVYKYVCF